MKKRELERKLKSLGWWFKRHGSNHDLWTNGEIDNPIPRHKEVKENLAKQIIRIAEIYPRKKEEQ